MKDKRQIAAGSESVTAKASFEKALNYLQAGNDRQAIVTCQSALKKFPNDADIRCLMGMAYTHQGKLKKGLQQLRTVVDQYPEFARGHKQMGNTLLAMKKLKAAADSFRQSLRIDPAQTGLYRKLAKTLSAQGKTEEATKVLAELSRLEPASAPGPAAGPDQKKLTDAADHLKAGRLIEARRIYRRLLRANPDDVKIMHQLAGVARRMNRLEEAVDFLNQAVTLRPNYAEAWTDLSIALQMREQFVEAVHCAESAVKIDPSNPYALMVLGESHFNVGHFENAISAYEKGLEHDPSNIALRSSLGNALRAAGRQQDAIDCYESSISLDPSLGEAYYNLANLKTYRFSDAQISTMEKQVADDAVRIESRINLHFALGKAHEDCGDFDSAMRHYRLGNDRRHAELAYDPKQTDSAHDHVRDVFSGKLIESIVSESPSSGNVAPIFIVGLPRSGSTLIEQILASHSLVEGTRELPTLGRIVRKLAIEENRVGDYPEAFEHLSVDARGELGRQYLDATQNFRTGKPYFIDKMPNNFSFIGAIRSILPDAKIINACRHPLSTSMSSYKQLFFGGQIFSYSLSGIAHYYLRYSQLMNHWHTVFPGFVLDVHYENLVNDQDAETRRLLDFCGLPFEESCLRFYETNRSVATASSEQVRQPIYRTSLDVWRPYEQHLDEVIEVLKPLLLDLPEEQRPQSLR